MAATATDRLEAAKLFERLRALGLVERPGEGGGLSEAIVEGVMVRVARRVRQGDLFLSRRDDDAFLERVMRMTRRKFEGGMPASSPSPDAGRGRRVSEAHAQAGAGPRCPNLSAGRPGRGEMLKRSA